MPALEFGWCGRLLPAHLDARESLYDQVHGERRRQVIYLAFAVVMEREPFERAARLSDELIDERKATRNLVPSDRRAAVFDELYERQRFAGARLDDGSDTLAPLLVGDAHHHSVEDAGV